MRRPDREAVERLAGRGGPAVSAVATDDGCEGAPEWSAELSIADLQRALRAAGFSGVLRNVKVAERNESGRVSRMTLDGLTPDAISGQDLRSAVGRTLGWQHLQSAAFELKRSGNAFRFSGHGNGHGVGLCVIGSAKLAENGETLDKSSSATFRARRLEPLGRGSRLFLRSPSGRQSRRRARPLRPRRRPLRPTPPAAAATALTTAADVLISLPEGDEGERSWSPRWCVVSATNWPRRSV